MGAHIIASMTELYLIIRISVKPKDRVSEQLEVLSSLDKKITIIHLVLYILTASIIGIYTYELIELMFLINEYYTTTLTLNDIISNSSLKVFKNFYSWSSCILLMAIAIALIVVFILLNKTIRDNLGTVNSQKDKQILNRLFGIFVLTSLLGAIYFWCFGRYSAIVCSVTWRWIIQDISIVTFDIPAAIAIFHLHHLNYKD